MAKNLKLNVKNAQLAEALKKLKKPEKPLVEKRVERPISKEQPSPPPPPSEPMSQEEVIIKAVDSPPVQSPEPILEPPKPFPQKTPLPPQRPSQYPSSFRPPYRPGMPRPEYKRPEQRQGQPPFRKGPPFSRPFQSPGGAPFSPSSGPRGFRPPLRPFQPRPFIPLKESNRADEPRKKVRTPEEEAASKKAASFKEFRDLKTQKKPETYRAFDSRDKQGLRGEDEESVWRRRRRPSLKERTIQEEVIRPKELKVRIPITIKDLAASMKLKASQLISSLFMKGVVLTLNDYLDDPMTIQLLGSDFDCNILIDTSEEERLKITDKTVKQEIQESPQENLVLRSPVATFMGHVDHGKTSLIDTIRKSDIVSGEAGAITQHIGAFRCHTPIGDITILDTPGHEAFSAMRERGADVTDLVVLVIAGDEGIRAQTVEAIKQAQAATVPIMVALNKSDKPNFNAENVYRQLSEHNLLPEAWGGTTITVNCSALTGEGIKELLEMLALQAEILELKANPQMRARGVVIESQMHKGLGAVATLLVQNGTLHLGDAIVFDQHWGRVKTMHDEYGKEMEEAPPSTPAKITGLSGLPEAGSEFIVVHSEKEAEELSEARLQQRQSIALKAKKAGIESFLQKEVQKQEKKIFNLILRADVQGSLEALRHSLEKIVSSKIEINIISAHVGEISESDIELAAASKATIIGFHTQIESHADSLIKELKVPVKLHDIIYHAIDDIKERMVGLLDKLAQENDMGEAVVKAIFKSSQLGNIAGCQVVEGLIRRNHHIRVVRDKEVIWKGPMASLKRVKEDAREVLKGQECGIVLHGFSSFKEGDILQAFEISYLTQEL